MNTKLHTSINCTQPLSLKPYSYMCHKSIRSFPSKLRGCTLWRLIQLEFMMGIAQLRTPFCIRAARIILSHTCNQFYQFIPYAVAIRHPSGYSYYNEKQTIVRFTSVCIPILTMMAYNMLSATSLAVVIKMNVHVSRVRRYDA